MPPRTQRYAPLHPLALRALVLYIPLRLLVTGIGIAGARAGVGSPDSPVGLVMLTILLGAIDIRRRGEGTLWGDLGFSPLVTWGLFGAVAAGGELAIALLRP